MNLQEFTTLINTCFTDTDLLNLRDVPIYFSYGLRLHVNELESDKHLSGTYVEFLESYARVSDEASLAPLIMEPIVDN